MGKKWWDSVVFSLYPLNLSPPILRENMGEERGLIAIIILLFNISPNI